MIRNAPPSRWLITMTFLTRCSRIATSRCSQKVRPQAGYFSVVAPSAAPARITWSYRSARPRLAMYRVTSSTSR
jgi:hypothetical protein